MIDHLLWHADKASALANSALSRWIVQTEDGPAWDESRVFADVKLVVSAGTTDEEGNVVTPYACLPGYWITIADEGAEPLPELVALTANVKLIANRERAQAGQPFIYPQGFNADPQVMALVPRIDGVPAGSNYDFSNPQIIT